MLPTSLWVTGIRGFIAQKEPTVVHAFTEYIWRAGWLAGWLCSTTEHGQGIQKVRGVFIKQASRRQPPIARGLPRLAPQEPHHWPRRETGHAEGH